MKKGGDNQNRQDRQKGRRDEFTNPLNHLTWLNGQPVGKAKINQGIKDLDQERGAKNGLNSDRIGGSSSPWNRKERPD